MKRFFIVIIFAGSFFIRDASSAMGSQPPAIPKELREESIQRLKNHEFLARVLKWNPSMRKSLEDKVTPSLTVRRSWRLLNKKDK